MACRRCLTTLTRQTTALRHSNHLLKSLIPLQRLPNHHSLSSTSHHHHLSPLTNSRAFSSSRSRNHNPPKFPTDSRQISDEIPDDGDDDEDEDEEDYTSANEVEEEEIDGNVGKRNVIEPACLEERSYYVEEKLQEAAEIGYKVVGPLKPDDRAFKHYELAFAVVQIGSHQFKVSNGDCIYVEKLKYCEVNDKLLLSKVLMVGSPTQTIIGRPILPEAAVHAVVEEHALDAKVIIFKKKRRKNYRRTKGHRQELTRLRITNIQGVEKTEAPFLGKSKSSAKKTEKVAVAA